ncbi:putative endosomal cargo receptor [Phaeomoniella chlamydospora]|uniref:Putative endosomal cargo receptor n=1 Tax=Phaeomoniella chlamydospora TaxID=158046 RepID=A0A0G2G1Z1_PHACM|nr:putative endosomal cargo receptor [Phaeomoniella chlamydospora]
MPDLCHYKFEAFSPQTQTFGPTTELGIITTVEETFDNDHRIVSQAASYDSSKSADSWYSKFTFAAADSGSHRICFTATGPASQTSGWFSSGNGGYPGGVRLTVDIVVGETSKIESEDKGKIDEMATKVKDLNGRLTDIRREQVFQREREAEFRDQSEATNARVVRWTLIQLGVLGITCAWQLSHLRAFFIKQKLT